MGEIRPRSQVVQSFQALEQRPRLWIILEQEGAGWRTVLVASSPVNDRPASSKGLGTRMV